VLTTFSDRKIATEGAPGYVAYYTAEILSSTDYYPFGFQMPGRSYTGREYRYGFNSMEKDDEVKGSGNCYDFGARIYDPRVGRWLAVDPLAGKYPNHSPYHYCLNGPITLMDVDGRLIVDKDGNPIYTQGSALMYEERSDGKYNMYQVRTYYANDGTPIPTMVRIKVVDKRPDNAEEFHNIDQPGEPLCDDEKWCCHSYTLLAYREMVNNSFKHVWITSRWTRKNGDMTEEFNPIEDVFLNQNEFQEINESLVKEGTVAVFFMNGKITHSSIMNSDGSFSSKDDKAPFNAKATLEQQKEWGEVRYFKREDDIQTTVKTNGGRVNKRQLKKALKEADKEMEHRKVKQQDQQQPAQHDEN